MTSKTTPKHANVWAALHAARADFTTIPMNGFNPHFKSKYATLTDIMNATMPALQKNELLMYQSPCIIEGETVLVSRIVHALTGECIEDWIPLNVKGKVQDFGSELSYKKRYMMAAQLCVTDGLDDDGEMATGEADAPKKPTPTKGKPPAKKPANTAQKTVVTTSTGAKEWTQGFTPEQVAEVESFASPPAVQEWALEVKAFDDEEQAREAFKMVVEESFGGELKQSTLRAAIAKFYQFALTLIPDDSGTVNEEDTLF